jgi:hypothetical protein
MGSTGEAVLAGNLAYALNDSRVRFINVFNPATPNEIGSYILPFSEIPDGAVDIAVSGNIAYIARFQTGLYLLDISNPAAPTLIGSYDSPDRTFGVAAAGNMAYLSGGQSGLSIIDLSNPVMPSRAGSHPGLVGWSNDVAIVGNKVYLADGLFGFGGLSIIDASIPTRPEMLGSIALGDAMHVTVRGTYAYLLVAGDLHIVDISHPSNPVKVGFYDNNVAWWVSDLDVKNNYVYVAGQDDGLIILRLLRHKITGGISTSGGYLASPSGDTYLYFPGGALTDIVALTYRHLWQDQDERDLVGIDHTFELEAVYHVTDQPAKLAPGQTFDILVQYSDAKTGPAITDTLALYYWEGSQWVKEASSTINPANHTVSARPNHWATLWAVLGQTRRMFLPAILKN